MKRSTLTDQWSLKRKGKKALLLFSSWAVVSTDTNLSIPMHSLAAILALIATEYDIRIIKMGVIWWHTFLVGQRSIITIIITGEKVQ